MQCSCGGETTDHKVQKNNRIVGRYAKCNTCGRICWDGKPYVLQDDDKKHGGTTNPKGLKPEDLYQGDAPPW